MIIFQGQEDQGGPPAWDSILRALRRMVRWPIPGKSCSTRKSRKAVFSGRISSKSRRNAGISHCPCPNIKDVPANRVPRRNLEEVIERMVGGDHLRSPSRHQKRLPHRIHDILSVLLRRLGLGLRQPVARVMSVQMITTPSITFSTVR